MKVVKLRDAIGELVEEDFSRPFVIPTETVYGLAARFDDPDSLEKVFAIKGRPRDNPLILHIGKIGMLEGLVKKESLERNRVLIEAFWPGPLTLIFSSTERVPAVVQGGCTGSVGIRMPRSADLCNLINKVGVPLAAPSANKSGRPSPTRVEHAISDLGDSVAVYIDDGPCDEGLESTIFGFIDGTPTVLRPGAVTCEQIEGVIGERVAVRSVYKEGAKVLSPGQKYRHYAPHSPLYLFKGRDWKKDMHLKASELALNVVGIMFPTRLFETDSGNNNASLCDSFSKNFPCKTILYSLGANKKEAAQRIFSGFRELEGKCDAIFVHISDTMSSTSAIFDRLSKAATQII